MATILILYYRAVLLHRPLDEFPIYRAGLFAFLSLDKAP